LKLAIGERDRRSVAQVGSKHGCSVANAGGRGE
jgi:hypothetical protein